MNFLQSTIAASLMLLAISCGNRDTNDGGAQGAGSTSAQDAALPKPNNGDISASKRAGGLPVIRDEELKSTPNEMLLETKAAEQKSDQPGDYNENSEKKGQVNERQEQGTAGQQIAGSNPDWNKKIIKNATLNIEVDNYKKYNELIHGLTTKWEAYIANEEETSSDYKIENAITIRIPVPYFDEAIQQISGHPGRMLVKQISSQDVTGEVIDTKARLEAKRKVRLRYLAMLDKAKSIDEVLQVERQANEIQEQIEAGEGRVNYLTHSAAYSTIQLTFFQVLDATVDHGEPGFGTRILSAFSNGLKWLGELLIIIATLWPLWLAIILGIFGIKKLVYLRRPAK